MPSVNLSAAAMMDTQYWTNKCVHLVLNLSVGIELNDYIMNKLLSSFIWSVKDVCLFRDGVNYLENKQLQSWMNYELKNDTDPATSSEDSRALTRTTKRANEEGIEIAEKYNGTRNGFRRFNELTFVKRNIYLLSCCEKIGRWVNYGAKGKRLSGMNNSLRSSSSFHSNESNTQSVTPRWS